MDRAWFRNTIDYLTQNDVDFAYWPLVGYLGPNNDNGWALMNWNPSNGQRDGLYDGNDWRVADWDRLVDSGRTGSIATSNKWQLLNLDYGDAIQSLVQKSRGDFDSGARKAMCPDGLRLIGVSRGSRGLCTDAVFGNGLWASGQGTITVTDERYVTQGDWAGGYTKYQCPQDYYAVGFAIRGTKVSSVHCAQAGRVLGTTQTTLWFDKGDNNPAGVGGDFHGGQYKAVCPPGEYIGGIAFTTRLFSSPNAAALLCKR